VDISKLAALKVKRLRRAERAASDPLSQDDLDNRLLDAASLGRSEAVSRWIALGANPNARDTAGLTALMGAAFAGSMECVALLLPLGRAEARDFSNNSPAQLAAKGGHALVCEAIIAFENARRESAELHHECSPALPKRRIGHL
jgi:ankyrin repeat protein